MSDDALDELREAVDSYIQTAGTLLLELRQATDVGDAAAQKDILDSLDAALNALKPELNQ